MNIKMRITIKYMRNMLILAGLCYLSYYICVKASFFMHTIVGGFMVLPCIYALTTTPVEFARLIEIWTSSDPATLEKIHEQQRLRD
jgi:hypothetical protein